MVKRRWRKSSHSGGDSSSGECVEIGFDRSDPVAIRDSKDPEGGSIELPSESMQALFRSLPRQ